MIFVLSCYIVIKFGSFCVMLTFFAGLSLSLSLYIYIYISSITKFRFQVFHDLNHLLQLQEATFDNSCPVWSNYVYTNTVRTCRMRHKVSLYVELNRFEFMLKSRVCLSIFPITRGRIFGFIPFLRISVLCEIQTYASRIWTQYAVSISYDGKHYTKGVCSKYSYSIIINCFHTVI